MTGAQTYRVATALGLVLTAAPLRAYEPFPATYDSEHKITLQGPVTRIEWTNPHAFLFVEVRDPQGTAANWAVEFGNPLELEKSGWKASALRIGDEVTVQGLPARGPHNQAFATSVVLTRSGKRLFMEPAAPRAKTAAQPAPR